MKRIAFAAFSTLAALVLLFSYPTSTGHSGGTAAEPVSSAKVVSGGQARDIRHYRPGARPGDDHAWCSRRRLDSRAGAPAPGTSARRTSGRRSVGRPSTVPRR